MTHRSLWVSYVNIEAALLVAQHCAIRQHIIRDHVVAHGVRTAAIFQHQHCLYGYCESDQPLVLDDLWHPVIGDMLLRVPSASGTALCIELPDIYHDGMPDDGQPWRAPDYTPQRRVGSLARLKPEQYCSYVYYHYVRQEEQPHGFNKYYIIGAHEHRLFSYQELPATVDTPRPRGSLRTKLTPNNWQALMHEHFELWADQPPENQEWIRLPCIWQF